MMTGISSPKSPIINSPKYVEDDNERTYLPDCWSNDKRMEVLFNPFRIRDTNPEGWDLKMNFWINTINKWCLLQRRAVFTIDDIRCSFIRNDQLPHLDCIKLVVSHMKRKGVVYFKDEYIPNKNSRHVTSLIVDYVLLKPVMFGWSFLSNSRSDQEMEEDKMLPISEDTKLINKEILDIFIESIECHLKNLNTTCMQYSTFFSYLNKNIFSEKVIDDSTYNVIMDVLQTKNKVKVHEDTGIKIVKFGKDIDIKETDVTLAKLEATKEILEAEAAKFYEAIEIVKNEAKTALQNKNRDKALVLLKRKKRLENKLKEKDNQIDNIDIIYEQLLDTDSQQLVMTAFQLANDILKKNTKQMESVENTINQLEDTLADVSSLTSDINRPIGDYSLIEMDAEEELKEMLKDIDDEQSAEQNLHQTNINNVNNILDQLNDMSIVDDELPIETSSNLKTILTS